jgi:RimJ/RimL family protein N-acetyltransferase
MRQSEGRTRGALPSDGTVSECRDLLTERLRMSPVTPADADEMAAVLADPSLYAWTGGTAPTPEALRSQYAVWAAAGATPVSGRRHDRTWVLRLGDGCDAVGFAQASVTADRATAVLAWVVGVRWQGRGLAREAAVRLVRLVREEGVTLLRAHIAPGHLASERVAAALGMAPTDRAVDGERVWETPAS